jgi:hypothetical protein
VPRHQLVHRDGERVARQQHDHRRQRDEVALECERQQGRQPGEQRGRRGREDVEELRALSFCAL